MLFTVIIPARLASTRLPGKVLLPIAGKPMMEHVYGRAKASGAERVIIATDSSEIEAWANAISAECVITNSDHPTGTSRICEAAHILQIPDDTIIVGVQADEPLINPNIIKDLANKVATYNSNNNIMATVAEPIKNIDSWQNQHDVKVVVNKNDEAMYFARAPIGGAECLNQENGPVLHHIGLYAYYARFLTAFKQWSPCLLEATARLEQLRALYHGAIMPVLRVPPQPGFGVDTQEDYRLICKILQD